LQYPENTVKFMIMLFSKANDNEIKVAVADILSFVPPPRRNGAMCVVGTTQRVLNPNGLWWTQPILLQKKRQTLYAGKNH
jgi:hypothetical protein